MRKELFYTSCILAAIVALASCSDDEDGGGCNPEFSIVVNEVVASSCTGATGRISVDAANANGAVQFRLNNGAFSTESDFANLAANTYVITARDANNCLASDTIALASDTDLQVAANVENVSGCGQDMGSISLVAQNGLPPYQYGIVGQPLGQESTLEGLAQGDYIVRVVDSQGCAVFVSTAVGSGVSFSASISSIIETNCAVTGCHVAGGRSPNLDDKATLLGRASRIKARTGNKSMPPPSSNRSLTDEEIALIACWADDGGMDN